MFLKRRQPSSPRQAFAKHPPEICRLFLRRYGSGKVSLLRPAHFYDSSPGPLPPPPQGLSRRCAQFRDSLLLLYLPCLSAPFHPPFIRSQRMDTHRNAQITNSATGTHAQRDASSFPSNYFEIETANYIQRFYVR